MSKFSADDVVVIGLDAEAPFLGGRRAFFTERLRGRVRMNFDRVERGRTAECDGSRFVRTWLEKQPEA